MFKSKLKLQLIEEYVKICYIEKLSQTNKNLCDSDENLITKRAKILKRCYELIFLRLGLIDLSFSILKKQINEKFYNGNEKNISKQMIENFLEQLVKFENEIENKMKKMHLSELEIKFMLNFC